MTTPLKSLPTHHVIAEKYTADPGFELNRLPDGWHVWSGGLCQVGASAGRHLIIRAAAGTPIPDGWTQFEPDGIEPDYDLMCLAPLDMDEDEAIDAAHASMDSAHMYVVVRPVESNRWVAATGVGGTTQHVRGSHPSSEAAAEAGRAATRAIYDREVRRILDLRRGMTLGIPIPEYRQPTILRPLPGQSAWDALGDSGVDRHFGTVTTKGDGDEDRSV
jgi:hypothetical protein